MNKLPLDIEENFQEAPVLQAFFMAAKLLEQADNPQLKEIAEHTLETILIQWAATSGATEN